LTPSQSPAGEPLSPARTQAEDCVAILAPFGQDATLVADVLRVAASPVSFPDMPCFCNTLMECAVGVLTTEALSPRGIEQLAEALHAQPAWSDIPLVLLANRIDPASYAFLAEALGNVVIIERPLDAPSLLTVVRTALRARMKQYQIRDLLQAAVSQQERIEALNDHLLLAVEAAEMGTWEVNLKTGMRVESASVGPLFGNCSEAATITLEEWAARIHADDRAAIVARFESALRGEAEYKVEYRTNAQKTQTSRWIASKAVVHRDATGEVLRVIGVVTDITERKNAEQELKQRQQEIEALNERLKRAMTETHHRVKNSLQLISAFVDMQANEHEEAVPVSELRRINTQVRTLAAVHDVLTHETKQRDCDDLVSAKLLLDKLFPMIRTMTGAKRLHYKIEDVRLRSRQGTSLALIANELILNALKHSGAEVEVTLSVSDDTVVLTVLDDGPGLPKDFSVAGASNTGLALVENLARWDLKGETVYTNRDDRDGARICVAFPILSEMERTQ
jgi:two-component sensor histidine kinase/PAS domain-containing protein